MKIALYIQAILEVLGGIAIYFAPELVLNGEITSVTLLMCKLYGVAAIVIGLLSLELGKQFEFKQLFKHIYLLFMLFQLLIAFTCFGFFQSGEITVGAVATHFLIFGIMCFFYFKDVGRFESK